MIKHTLTLWITAATLGVGQALAQEPPAPPVPPNPPPPAAANPVPPPPPKAEVDRLHREHRPERARETAAYLGVEVMPLPEWVGEQLNLPDGFGLLVSYVVPGGPADLAGVKRHDILKQYNDQMLANPEQLTALVQSGKAEQDAALTVLRKGQESKLTAKLQTRPERERDADFRRGVVVDRALPRRERAEDREDEDMDEPPAAEVWRELGPEIRDIARNARREAANARREAAEQMRNARREIMILRDKNGKSTSTKMDLSQGRIVVKDDQGELEINGSGKDGGRLVAKDPQGKVTYDGAIKDAPAPLLERVGRFGGGKIRIDGNKIEMKSGDDFSFNSDDKEDDDEDAKPAKSAPATPAPAAPSPGA